jgi:hypothetical protein
MLDPVKRRKPLRRILAVFAVIVTALALTIGLLSWRKAGERGVPGSAVDGS